MYPVLASEIMERSRKAGDLLARSKTFPPDSADGVALVAEALGQLCELLSTPSVVEELVQAADDADRQWKRFTEQRNRHVLDHTIGRALATARQRDPSVPHPSLEVLESESRFEFDSYVAKYLEVGTDREVWIEDDTDVAWYMTDGWPAEPVPPGTYVRPVETNSPAKGANVRSIETDLERLLESGTDDDLVLVGKHPRRTPPSRYRVANDGTVHDVSPGDSPTLKVRLFPYKRPPEASVADFLALEERVLEAAGIGADALAAVRERCGSPQSRLADLTFDASGLADAFEVLRDATCVHLYIVTDGKTERRLWRRLVSGVVEIVGGIGVMTADVHLVGTFGTGGTTASIVAGAEGIKSGAKEVRLVLRETIAQRDTPPTTT